MFCIVFPMESQGKFKVISIKAQGKRYMMSLKIKEVIYMNDLIIETKDLTKCYGKQKSVSDLNLHVRRGRIYGLLGRNVPIYKQQI